MLPILRILPVGGVLLAIMILVLALSPPSGLHPASTPAGLLARGALTQPGEHPEWRQFLILAAIHRAEQLSRLRDLPDMPVPGGSTPDAGKFAGLPATRSDSEPDDETGSIADRPSATIPVEIGEPSSTELPVSAPRENPPVITTPERVKVPNESHNKKGVHRARHAKPSAKALAKTEPTPPINGLEALFGIPQAKPKSGPQTKPKPGGNALASQPANGGLFP
jgi:hypothetical protein